MNQPTQPDDTQQAPLSPKSKTLFSKTFYIIVLILVLGFAALYFGIYGYLNNYIANVTTKPTPQVPKSSFTPNPTATPHPSLEPNKKACTLEAKLCPDGSYVPRDPKNNCEFSPCP